MNPKMMIPQTTAKSVASRALISGVGTCRGWQSQVRPTSALALGQTAYGHAIGFTNGLASVWTNAHPDARGLITS